MAEEPTTSISSRFANQIRDIIAYIRTIVKK
jgi:hypothetical protein